MNRQTLFVKKYLTLALFLLGQQVFCQDSLTSLHSKANYTGIQTVAFKRFQPSFDYLYHAPDEKDERLYKQYQYLVGQAPSSKNYERYYALACSLWEMEKTQQAEKMFLTIIRSNEKFYSSTYYHSSDIPGDTATHSYGYGSFSSHYKSSSAIYLAKIYLEQQQYESALQYLNDAVKKYKVTYNCGTGHLRQQNEYDFFVCRLLCRFEETPGSD